MQYSHILLTHDGSELAETAVAHAEAIAAAFGSRVTVMRVIETVGEVMMHMAPTTLEAQGSLVAEVAEDVVASERQVAESEIAGVAESIRAAGATDVSTVIAEGAAGPAIVEVAAAEGCDLIVMATHGRSGLKRAVLGSVADHVLHEAPCPVLLCRSID
jgi:nucleotide-binding universal stress UspA family protein